MKQSNATGSTSIRPKSLYRELTIALVVLVTVVSVAVSLANYFYSSQEADALLESKVSGYTANLRESLEWPLWNLDDELIVKIGRAFVTNAEIVTLTIRDDRQQVVYQQKNSSGNQLRRVIAIEHNGQNIGSVEIGLSLHDYEEKNRWLLFTSIATALLLIVVLFGTTRLILSRLLKKPLDVFIGATSDMIDGKYRQIELPETYVEFAPILIGFKTMFDAVASRESSLRQTNEHLAAEVDEHRRAKEALRASEERFKTMFNQAPLGIAVIDSLTGQIYDVNPMFAQIAGRTIEQMANIDWISITQPEDVQRDLDQMALLNAGKIAGFQMEKRYLHLDGTAVWINMTIAPLKVEDKALPRHLCMIEDITERRRTEDALRVNEERLKLATSAGNVGIWDWDVVGNVLTWDESMYALYGICKEEFSGAYDAWLATLHPDDRQFVDGEIQAALRGEREYAPEFRIIRPDGTVRTIKASSKTYCDPQGNPIRMVGTNFDITDIKHIEDELRKYKDHLEDEVQLRTADLVLARNAAEAANRAKSVFLSSMSHELRTPLNAILGFSSMMRKDALLSQEQRENLDIINRSGEHLLTLINDVLEMAKIEAGRVQLESVPFDLGALVRDVTDMMHVRAQEKGLQLLVDQSSEFPRYIKGDEARVRQVLTNLVGNAVKFTQQGGITVRFGLKPRATPPRLLIEVEDSGIGISAADQKIIFDPFVQLEKMATQTGTGLGLTITRQFVQLMGGSISVESNLGNGSIFRVELPVEKVAAADVLKPAGVIRGDIVGLAAGQPEYRILIVEDQLENQLLLARLMKIVGFQIKVAENGEQAVSLFQSWQPHLIWMDRRMPVMDGIEATRRIRELPGGTDVKIVAVTASAFKEQRDEILAAGMDDFVRKPYRFNEIYECLTKQLGVQYTYAVAQVAEEVSDVVLTADMLTVLPQELRGELRSALETLDSERISAVIEQVTSYDVELHKTLLHLAENFDYPAILKALEMNPPVTVT